MKSKGLGLIVLFLFLCVLARAGESFSQAPEKTEIENHVMPGKYAAEFAATLEIPESPLEATHKLIETLHDRELFSHVNRKDMANFGQKGFSLEKYKRRLEAKLARTRDKREKAKLEKSIEVLDAEYRAWQGRYSAFDRRDWPFCLSGEEYVQYRITDGCTSFAKLFMTLANELGLYQDMRLLISKSFDGLKENIDLLGTDRIPQKPINGHQMVLAKWDDKWRLINVTIYKPKSKKREVEEYEILDKVDSVSITPENILYKKLDLPAMATNTELRSLVAAAVGKDRYDDLGVRNLDDSLRIGTAIPRKIVEALMQ
jgi:hypothetical protein